MNILHGPLLRIGTLQTRIIVFFGLLMVAVQVVALLLIHTVGVSNAHEAIDVELATGERVFNQLVLQRTAQLSQGARVLSGDYAFRQALASRDGETIRSALANHGARIDAQLMTLVGLDYRVIADSESESSAGQAFAMPKLLATAERNGMSSSIVIIGGRLYQVVVVPVATPLPVAWVVIGFVVDDGVAKELQRITDLDVTFFSGSAAGTWTLQASTLPDAMRTALARNMDEGRLKAGHNAVLNGDEYVSRVSQQAATGDVPVVAVLQVALARALGPFRRLMQELVGIAIIAILVSMLCSVVIARGIAQPVKQLAGFARRIAAGDYSDPPQIVRTDEIGDLSTAFDHMRDGIANREHQILDLAYRDSLTGLPNRALFVDRVQQAVANARRTHVPLCVMILDLDRFKYVNDSLGHDLGDLLLKQVADRLSTVTRRDTDTVARLGGDEFAVLLAGTNLDAARRFAGAITRALDEPILLDGHVVDVRASIGIAGFPEHGDDHDGLIRRADVAMYLAKRNNTGQAVYDVAYDQHSADRLSLMGELRKAVEENQLVIHYQPKIGLVHTSQRCVEALVRWQHPRRGFVPPDEFIPFAEQTGYIRAITMWMLDRAAAQCAQWRREGIPITIAVNISARDLLNPEMPTRFAEMLVRHGCPADSIWLEITESAILEDAARSLETLDRLAALGCKLSIDDYGTGYSSLSYLKKLPVDELKIDRSFVMNMLEDRDDRVIVQSTIDLAHNMGLTVTAEGVEDQQTLDRLRAMGCDMAQGFLMSRPIPAAELARWMRETRWITRGPSVEPVRLVG